MNRCAPPTRRRCARSASSCPAAPSLAWCRLRDGTVHAAAAWPAAGRLAAGCGRRLSGDAGTAQAASRGHAVGMVPPPAAAEELPLRTASLDLVTVFNCVHHFDLGRFLAAAARVLQPGGQLFIYTRTPQQNARTIWGRYFPGFTENEQRLHSQAAIRDAVRRSNQAQDWSQHRSSSTRAPGRPSGSGHSSRGATTRHSPSTRRRSAPSHRDLPGPPARSRGFLG